MVKGATGIALMVRLTLSFVVLSGAVSAAALAGEPSAADLTILREARLPSDPASLIAYLQTRSQPQRSEQDIHELVGRLTSTSGDERSRAITEIVRVGPATVPALRMLASDSTDAGSSAARQCLSTLELESNSLSGAVLRVTAARRVAAAAAALIAFVPYAEDEGVVEETSFALTAVAAGNEEVISLLIKALDDPVALRRAVAAEALSQTGYGYATSIRKLLHDPNPVVRFRSARALVRLHDSEGVPTLIVSLKDLPMPLALAAEEELIALATEQAPGNRIDDNDSNRTRCQEAWSAWWKTTEDYGALLEPVRKRVFADLDHEKVAECLRDLGDDSFEVRERVTDVIKSMGPAVLPILRKACDSPDLEIRQRTQSLVQAIEKQATAPLSLSVPRLIALRKPPRAAELLLNYVPFADDDAMLAEVQEALNTVAFRDGKAEPAVIRALADKTPARRVAAAEALASGQAPLARELVRKLFNDAEPVVRAKAATALLRAGDRSAVPVLISLAADTVGEAALIAEESLLHLAGDRLPAAVSSVAGNDAAARGKRGEAWSAWWQGQADRTDPLVRPGPRGVARLSGITLLVHTRDGSVAEVESGGRVRWQITGLASPRDAQVLRGDRVLIAESGICRVTERNLKGQILWEKETSTFPISACRLPDGRTVIVARDRISIVDRSGREVSFISRPTGDIMTARRLQDGKFAIITNQACLVILDPGGREIKTRSLPSVTSFNNEILPDGGMILPIVWQNEVIEYTPEGRVAWQARVPQPIAVSRLANGHTLVTTQGMPFKIIELDKNGKQVAEMITLSNAQFATRR